MGELVLAACGPEPIDTVSALAAVRGYAGARRWLFVRTPSQPSGHWVRVPAYPFDVFDRQPSSTDPGLADLDVLAADGLLGPLPWDQYGAFAHEMQDLVPEVDHVLSWAAGQAFWELPPSAASEGPLIDALGAARATSDPDRAVAVLHHRRPRLFPLMTARTASSLCAIAAGRGCSAWAVLHEDLTTNAVEFGRLETQVAQAMGVPVARSRLYDLLLWLTVTRRWADAVGSGVAQ